VYSLSEAERRAAVRSIANALRDGALSPLVGARFGLEETAMAHEAVESGALIGHVLIDIP